jgi:hypothetical protein
MRELTKRGLQIALACLAAAALAGCNTEAKNCEKVAGLYQPLYTPVDGNCGALTQVNMVPFDGGLHGVNTIMQNLANALVTTDIVMKGCTIHMTQTVHAAEGGLIQSEIDGLSIRIESQDRLTGRVAVTKYDQFGMPACAGNYDAAFTKPMVTTGGAVAGIGSAGSGM